MPLGTIDRTPPPFFRQGVSALTKLVFCSALALFLMIADTRFTLITQLRAALATLLHPVERALLVPNQTLTEGALYLHGLAAARGREEDARRQLALQSQRVTEVERLQAENARLRALLDLQPALKVRSTAAEVLYEAKDPYSRKLFIDRGAQAGIVAGAPVINEQGVVGQVTRVYPLTAEVTLMVDKDAVVPVLNTRTQQRSAAYGTANGLGMELRFVPTNTDVRRDDALVTSGVDGVYPSGIAVARVADVRRQGAGGFSQIDLVPVASLDSIRHLLVLEPIGLQLPPPPEPAPKPAADPRSRRKP